MTEFVTIDQIDPQRILQKIGSNEMAFAESFKGQGNRDDGNFQDFNTHWRTEAPSDLKEIWLEMFRRNVVRACASGFNFCEFWGWPEVRCRDDGTAMVAARIRILRISHVPPQMRPN